MYMFSIGQIDVRRYDGRLLPSPGEHTPPGIDHHRISIGRKRRFLSRLPTGRDVAAILDGPGPQERLPVRLSRLPGKICRDQDHLCSGPRHQAEHLTEAQIIADGKPQICKARPGHYDLLPRLYPVRLPVCRPLGDLYVEHVDLPVTGDHLSRGIEQEAGVKGPPLGISLCDAAV